MPERRRAAPSPRSTATWPSMRFPIGSSASSTASSGDIYDEGQVLRQTIEIEAEVGPGDSGAPLLDETGAMVGLLFAESEGVEDRPGRSTSPRSKRS